MAVTPGSGDVAKAAGTRMSDEPPERRERLTLTRAVTLLSWHFLHSEALTTREAARMTGYSHSGAYKLLCEMSGAMPLVQDRQWRWQLESMLEPDCS